jgi:cobaltochelatase CobT
MLTEGVLKENVDGEALLWAAERGRRLGGATIVHVTDGTPMDDSTLAVNPSDYLNRHLEIVTDLIRADPDLKLISARLTAGTSRFSEIGLGRISVILVEATLQAIAASMPDPDLSVTEGP